MKQDQMNAALGPDYSGFLLVFCCSQTFAYSRCVTGLQFMQTVIFALSLRHFFHYYWCLSVYHRLNSCSRVNQSLNWLLNFTQALSLLILLSDFTLNNNMFEECVCVWCVCVCMCCCSFALTLAPPFFSCFLVKPLWLAYLPPLTCENRKGDDIQLSNIQKMKEECVKPVGKVNCVQEGDSTSNNTVIC